VASQTEPSRRYPCKCCGFLSLTDPANGSYEICPVCFWEDDPVQNDDPSFAGGANDVSLAHARENYVRFGACEPSLGDRVRSPNIDEIPPPTSVAGLGSANQISILRGVKTSILGIVRGMLSGQIGILEGCSAVAAVGWPLNEPTLDDILRTFEGVATERDEFPNATSRHLWEQEALKVEDAKTADYERRIRDSVQNACVRLEGYLQSQLRR
jgi:hypothetical protein